MERIEDIRQAYYRDGKSVRQIAREQHHSREVVAAALQEALPRKYTLASPRFSPVLGEAIPLIDQWLADDLQRPKKQRHTAHRVWQRLRDEYGFAGAESTVRAYVRDHRPVADGSRVEEAIIRVIVIKSPPAIYASGQPASGRSVSRAPTGTRDGYLSYLPRPLTICSTSPITIIAGRSGNRSRSCFDGAPPWLT